jgi:hypothetical protein
MLAMLPLPFRATILHFPKSITHQCGSFNLVSCNYSAKFAEKPHQLLRAVFAAATLRIRCRPGCLRNTLGAICARIGQGFATNEVVPDHVAPHLGAIGEILINDTLRDSQKSLVFKRFSHFPRTLNVAFSRYRAR